MNPETVSLLFLVKAKRRKVVCAVHLSLYSLSPLMNLERYLKATASLMYELHVVHRIHLVKVNYTVLGNIGDKMSQSPRYRVDLVHNVPMGGAIDLKCSHY